MVRAERAGGAGEDTTGPPADGAPQWNRPPDLGKGSAGQDVHDFGVAIDAADLEDTVEHVDFDRCDAVDDAAVVHQRAGIFVFRVALGGCLAMVDLGPTTVAVDFDGIGFVAVVALIGADQAQGTPPISVMPK
jgi:hypothetical protein